MFCDPQAPYQKGTVENTNNRLRKYLPRSTDPTALTNRYLRSICHRLKSTPRKCLDYRTPAEVFETKRRKSRTVWNKTRYQELHFTVSSHNVGPCSISVCCFEQDPFGSRSGSYRKKRHFGAMTKRGVTERLPHVL